MSAYNRGGRIGSKIGRFGTAGGATEMIDGVAAIPKAGVSAGHFILGGNDDKNNPQNKNEDDKKKQVDKGMRLYIDLVKAAGAASAGGVDSDISAEQNEEEYEDSYEQRTSGVMGGDASPDTPGPGRKINEKTKKSLSIAGDTHFMSLSPEEEFMTKHLGYDVRAVRRGNAFIAGSDVSRFQEFLVDRMNKSINDLGEY